MTKTIFEKSQPGQHAYSIPGNTPEFSRFSPPDRHLRESPLPLPEISEIDLTRHYIGLSRKNMGIDNNFYPLGSCTMKFNPRINEACAGMPGFTRTHPLAPEETIQGNLEVAFSLLHHLCYLCGMSSGTLLPNAGAQGELTGIQMIAAYHKKNRDDRRTEILVPDSAHGTNPATASMAGFTTITIKSNDEGDLDLEQLKSVVSEKTAGLMLTNPSTLGLFITSIREAAKIVHDAGGLLYYDGANLNPLLHFVRPGDMGFDVMHINLHKTFSTPHGGGGPGSGPVLCNDKLKEFLPVPKIVKEGSGYHVDWSGEHTIGQMATFHGNFGIYLRAYVYLITHGYFGLRKIAEMSVLNANYLKKKIGEFFTVPYSKPCMHEFVVRADRFLDKGIRAVDIAKRLLDYGVHAPTIYFPSIVKECMLIEPTESESLATLDSFIDIIKTIVREIEETPDLVKSAPHNTPVSRLDEVKAAKDLGRV